MIFISIRNYTNFELLQSFIKLFYMYLRRSPLLKNFIAIAVGCLLYGEWIVYLLQPYYWNKLECKQGDSTCVKILFVADPQIQGDDALPPPLSYLVNWDSDRYLSSTFQVVLNHFKPEVIVYLGDLMDEGSVSNIIQFHGYVKRLANIFDINYPVVQIWLPGDNDIGGEGEPVRVSKVQEFNKVFKQPDVIHYRNLSFYKVNGITYRYPKEIRNENFKIVVSHYPITVSTYFGQMVNNAIRPNIYFCAHDHTSKYVTQSRSLTFRETKQYRHGQQVLNVAFDSRNDEIYEIYVPTCSYRMGTRFVGYGAAVFQNFSQDMSYTVFWSSQRFPYLIIYLLFLLIIFAYFCLYSTKRLLLKCCTQLPTSRKKIKPRIKTSEEITPFLA